MEKEEDGDWEECSSDASDLVEATRGKGRERFKR